MKNVEYLLMYLVTEFEPTPHAVRQGRNVPEIQRVYSSIVSVLVSSRLIPLLARYSYLLISIRFADSSILSTEEAAYGKVQKA